MQIVATSFLFRKLVYNPEKREVTEFSERDWNENDEFEVEKRALFQSSGNNFGFRDHHRHDDVVYRISQTLFYSPFLFRDGTYSIPKFSPLPFSRGQLLLLFRSFPFCAHSFISRSKNERHEIELEQFPIFDARALSYFGALLSLFILDTSYFESVLTFNPNNSRNVDSLRGNNSREMLFTVSVSDLKNSRV